MYKRQNKYTRSNIALQPLNSIDYEISKSALLNYQQHMMFSQYIDSIARNTALMKESIVYGFNERIDTIINGAQKALSKELASSPPTITAVDSKNTSEQISSPPAIIAVDNNNTSIESLLAKGGISDQDIELLKNSSQFLNFKISSYSPDPIVKDLALKADVKLQDIISMLNNELEILKALNKPRVFSYQRQQTDNTASVIPQNKDKNVIISELIKNLQEIKGLVNNTSTSKWNIDLEIGKAKESIRSYVENIHEKENALKIQATMLLPPAGGYLLGAIISALILLVIRDFMSAVIDTATNTGGMLKKLSGMDVEIK